MFQFAGTDFRDLEIGERLGFVSNGLERTAVASAGYALNVKEENRRIDFLTNALSARKDGGVLVEKVHPKVGVLGTWCLVGYKSDHTFLSFSLESHDFAQGVVFGNALCAMVLTHFDKEFVHRLVLQRAVEFGKCSAWMQPEGEGGNPFPVAKVSEIDKYKIVCIKGTVYSLAVLKRHVALHLLRFDGKKL